MLSNFEYCMPIWSSTAEYHLKLLHRTLKGIKINGVEFNLKKRLLYNIFHNPKRAL